MDIRGENKKKGGRTWTRPRPTSQHKRFRIQDTQGAVKHFIMQQRESLNNVHKVPQAELIVWFSMDSSNERRAQDGPNMGPRMGCRRLRKGPGAQERLRR